MLYLLSFLEGVLTFISPCLLPLLPVYISFFAAGESGSGYIVRSRAFFNSLGFVCGFTVIFVFFGAFAGTIGGFLNQYSVVFNLVTGIIVIFFGLNFIGIINLTFLFKTGQKTLNTKQINFLSAALFGMTFSISWTSCTGPFLGSALMKASQTGDAAQGIIMLLFYSMGLGIPFIASSLLLDQLKAAFNYIKKNYRIINIVSGILLVVAGVLMATGLMGVYLRFFLV